jgi:hypothetical protein
MRKIGDKNMTTTPKYPSFFARFGRKPQAHVDYDPDACFSADDVDFLDGNGEYSDSIVPGSPEDMSNQPEDDCPLDGDAESALASAGFGMDEDYEHYDEWEQDDDFYFHMDDGGE